MLRRMTSTFHGATAQASLASATPARTSSTQWLPVVTTATDITAGSAHTATPAVGPPRRRAIGARVDAASTVQATWKLGMAAWGLKRPDGWATAPSNPVRPS